MAKAVSGGGIGGASGSALEACTQPDPDPARIEAKVIHLRRERRIMDRIADETAVASV